MVTQNMLRTQEYRIRYVKLTSCKGKPGEKETEQKYNVNISEIHTCYNILNISLTVKPGAY